MNKTTTQALREIYGLLSSRRRTQFWLLLAGVLVLAGIENVAILSIALFSAVVTSPTTVLESGKLELVTRFLPLGYELDARSLLLASAVLLLVSVLAKSVATAVFYYCRGRLTGAVWSDVYKQLLGGLLRLPFGWHQHQNSSDLVLAAYWSRQLAELLNQLLVIEGEIFAVLLIIISLVCIQPDIFVPTFVLVGLAAFAVQKLVGRRTRANAERTAVQNQRMGSLFTKAMHGIRDIKIMDAGATFHERGGRNSDLMPPLVARETYLSRLPLITMEFIGFGILVGITIGMVQLLQFPLAKTVGLLALLAVAAWRTLPGVGRTMGALTSIQNVLPHALEVLRLLDMVASSRLDGTLELRDSTAVEPLSFADAIVIEDVSFTYPGAESPALSDVSFSIGKNQAVGIIGRSGSGKTTLVDLMVGLFPPDQGGVLIDGVRLDVRNRSAWLANVGYVPQDPYIIDGTICENVAFVVDAADADRVRVEQCCREAAMDFLGDLKAGIDTQIGERGVRLSGGQRQRIAIARALYKEPSFLVFDEATSSLDSHNEGEILDTIETLKGSRSMVIIAHRLSTVRRCDSIVWLERGEVIQEGRAAAVIEAFDAARPNETSDRGGQR